VYRREVVVFWLLELAVEADRDSRRPDSTELEEYNSKPVLPVLDKLDTGTGLGKRTAGRIVGLHSISMSPEMEAVDSEAEGRAEGMCEAQADHLYAEDRYRFQPHF
jgi:hypothetical protein